ncbi:hypothetical protein OBB02_03580 [Candidatus Puniceispirillum sp.]|nr:hypothetical protein [Candidatus Puniceispirillum sp.]
MANPGLKAKIEAAKSALEEDQHNTPLSQERDDEIAPKTALSPSPDYKPTSPGTAEKPTKFEPDAASLDARITHLENSLLENKRDLHTLLGKIREVSRLQNEAPKKNGQKNPRPNDISSDEQKVNRRQSRKIAITLAVLTGIILGTSFFLASDFIDQHLLHLITWAMQFADFISDIFR